MPEEARPLPPDQTPDEKPFRLAKSFSVAAIILIFASVLILAAVVSRQAEIIITKRIEDDTIKLMTNLNHQMYENFLKKAIGKYGKISLSDPIQRVLLREVIDSTTFGFDLKRVIIYDDRAQAVFATDDTRLLSTADDVEAVREAVTRYTSEDRLRIIRPERSQEEDETAVPDADASPPDAQPGPESAPSGPNSVPGAKPPERTPLAERRYETPSPYLYFRVEPFGSGSGENNLDDEPPAQDMTDGAEAIRPDDDPDAAENMEPGDDSGRNSPESVEEAKNSGRGLPVSARTPGGNETRYHIVTIGAYRYLLADVDDNSPAAAQIIVGDDNFFLEYQRSQTVFRHEGGRYLLLNFFPAGEFSLRSYKVMESYEATRGHGVSGILEITRDLTPEYKQIARLQYFAFGIAAFLALVLTISLRWVVSRGEAILNKRNLERQALREQLDQAERLAGLGSMVATVAHEIRNPLGIIHSTADVLDRFLADDQDKARLAKAIVEEADRLSTVVTEFLDFARPPKPKPTPIVVEEILEEILAFLEITMARAGVEVRCDFRQDQSPVMGDGPMLHRAFLNIIMNAIQAMDDGGLMTVATRLECKDGGDWLAVSVSDTGPGLSEESAKKMFSPFYTTKAKGTGLGLVIVRNIIEGHNGEIEMISGLKAQKDEDAGLTVIIRLKAD